MGLLEKLSFDIESSSIDNTVNISKYSADVMLGAGIGLTYSAAVTGQYLWFITGIFTFFAGGLVRAICGRAEYDLNRSENS